MKYEIYESTKATCMNKKSWKIIDEWIKCVVVIHSIISYQNKKKLFILYLYWEKQSKKIEIINDFNLKKNYD